MQQASRNLLQSVGAQFSIMVAVRDSITENLIREILEPYGYQLSFARNSENAFGLCMRRRVDLLVAQSQMEGMSGLDLCRKIKSTPRTGTIAVLLLSDEGSTQDRERIFRVGADDYLVSPPEPLEFKARIRNIMRVRTLQSELEKERNSLVVRVRERTEEVEALTTGLVTALERANALNDEDTGAHILRVCITGEHLARALGLSAEFCDKIRRFASLHDIGKVGLPDSILKKRGPLTPEERTSMEKHTDFGYELLKTANADIVAQNIAYTHHEWFDGTGYPRGLRTEQIPLEGRIVALADVFDALMSKRCYKPAMSEIQALDIIHAGKGTHFDPKILEVFVGEMHVIREIRAENPDASTLS